MFARRTRGLFEFTMALLCLWAAGYHTPVGALLRRTGARLFGIKTSARPLLAYYSGTSTPHTGDSAIVAPPLPVVGPQFAKLTPGLAMGLGLHAALKQVPPSQRKAAFELARLEGLSPDALLDDDDGARASSELLDRATTRLGSPEAAVLAAFAGTEPARYAVERSRADGNPTPTLEVLARHLPPGFEDAVTASSDALAFGTAYGLAWPVPESTPISSPFGMRLHPILGTRKLHTGVDLPQAVGSPVRVTADGIVRRASEDGVNGRVLVIDHGRGVSTAYCHNSELLVQVGEVVHRGQVIARSGNTGRSTGPHVHYQLELSDHPVDPLAFHPRVRPGVESVSGLGGD